MIVTISPSTIKGKINAPASKSSMQRACAAALLYKGISHIYNAGISNDDKAALQIITHLGAVTSVKENVLIINSSNFCEIKYEDTLNIHCGESGLSIRMFAPIAALLSNRVCIEGSGSLMQRPMHFFDEIFPKLGIEITSSNGKLPLKIKGPLVPKNITVDGSLSSQFLTGLLFAFAASAKNEVTITVNNLKSKPYIDLTLAVMAHFGFVVDNEGYKNFIIHPLKNIKKDTITYTVESDWSSASFLLVAGAIAGAVKVTGLNIQSTQADKAILSALQLCKANITINNEDISVEKANLVAFHFDATDCPDLFPPLVALAACCAGKTVIKGTHRLAAKESDRAITLQDIFGKMGIQINLKGDEMIVEGGVINGATVSSHHDHRIAMAAALAGLVAQAPITITGADAINKSYPQFFDDIKKIGGGVE